MNLIIEKVPSDTNLSKFINDFLIPKIRDYFIVYINDSKLKVWDDFFNSIDFEWVDGKKRKISTKDLLIGSIYNLVWKFANSEYTISINPNAVIPNLSAKFIYIAQAVNYGNMSCPAYPIYTDVFDYFAKNLGKYYREYIGD